MFFARGCDQNLSAPRKREGVSAGSRSPGRKFPPHSRYTESDMICRTLPRLFALRANHESLCRGGPPLAANGAATAHPRASTVRAPARVCDAMHRRRFQRTRKPRFAGTQNGASAPRLHKGFTPLNNGHCVGTGVLWLFVSGRRPAFVSRGVGCEASGKGPCVEAASLLGGLHARPLPGAKGFHAPRFCGRA